MEPASYFESFVPDMTGSSLGSRKRGRCDGDDESRDFTPLSKRINNLHINNSSYNDPCVSSHEETHFMSQAEGDGISAVNEERRVGMAMGSVQQPIYNPNLTVSDNPFYYESNKLLYYLNIERLQRSGQSYG